MKASEIIKELKKLTDKNGDLEVVDQFCVFSRKVSLYGDETDDPDLIMIFFD